MNFSLINTKLSHAFPNDYPVFNPGDGGVGVLKYEIGIYVPLWV